MIRQISARPLLLTIAAVAMFSGCQSVIDVIRDVGTEAGRQAVLTSQQAAFIGSAANAIWEAGKDLSPEQEYFIGRSVGAMVLRQYAVLDAPAANRYLNLLGQGLAQYSDRPEIYSGYRFLALDSLEINAFATPGGHILVTRGLLACARSEDELAAILAHEIVHVAHRHGMNSIKNARFGEALAKITVEAGKLGGADIARFSEIFGDSIQDITTTLVKSGYSNITEFDADIGARSILLAAGYNPAALESLLSTMKSVLQTGDRGFGLTHPSPELRMANLRTPSYPANSDSQAPFVSGGSGFRDRVRSERFRLFAESF
jgi:predicted Zn-dependent protease